MPGQRGLLQFASVLGLLLGLGACGTAEPAKGANPGEAVSPDAVVGLAINEVMAKNEGAWIDPRGQTNDWIELVNRGEETLDVGDAWLEDSSGRRARLAGPSLEPGERWLLWADGSAVATEGHLPFELKSAGEQLVLTDESGRELDVLDVPELADNEVFARFPDGTGEPEVCRYASPRRHNGASCLPPEPPALADEVTFEAAELSPVHPPAPAGLGLSELALRPDGGGAFVELENRSAELLDLDAHSLRLSAHAPHLPWPGPAEGRAVTLPAGVRLAAGERVAVEVPSGALEELEADPSFEGVVTLFARQSGEALDRVDFMSWPPGASLMRVAGSRRHRFCSNATPGAADECLPLASRPVGERLRHLRTPADHALLGAGGEQLGIRSVKFVVDLSAPGLVHLLSAERWPLHYTFVRERVYREPQLDRCDPVQNAEFRQGWSAFSATEYYRVEGRRFLLGTLSHHGGAGLRAVEYTFGDVITGAQMRDGFLEAAAHTEDPSAWALRPQDDNQVAKVRAIEGSVPLVGPNAPFAGVTYQPLAGGVGYGTLRFVPASELGAAALGPDIIVVTDDVPNDIPLVGGLVTEAFQTPLAHVNVLSQNRRTPNASLKDARVELGEWLGRLVRLEVGPEGLQVSEAAPEEALSFWQSRAPSGPLAAARLDATLRGVQPLEAHGLASLPAIGAKAAQLAELGRQRAPWCGSQELILTPASPFAIPLVHSLEHLESSGARALLDQLDSDGALAAEPEARALALTAIRERILAAPVDAALLREVESAIAARFGSARVRLRSSSNAEDLPDFNGAGLYSSHSAEVGDPERRVEDALRGVWASLYDTRAYDERRHARIDERSVAMGVLVHEAFRDEEANGVAVSRNVLDPTRGDMYYLNAQAGEASVTNPAPGVTTEQLIYRWGREPPILYQSESSLLAAFGRAQSHVLSEEEVVDLTCALRVVHDVFAPLLDPDDADPWFAMEVEFKLLGPERRLLLKQARPHPSGAPSSTDCREL